MPKNQQNHSNSDVDNIKEGISKMVIKKEEEFDESIEYPYRPGEPDCRFYLQNGRCNYGTKCHFNHPPPFSQSYQYKSEVQPQREGRPDCGSYQYKSEQLPQREGRPDCGFFLKTGSCNFGSRCKYHHPLERRPSKVPLNSLGLPLRKEENCNHFMKYLRCKYGAACKFNHPEPTSAKTALPAVSGSTTAVGTGAYLPSPVMPYVASSPALPWTSSSYFPGQPSYVPYIPAGVVAIPNWNGYPGENTCGHFISRNGPPYEYSHPPIAGYISGYYLGMPFVQGVNQQPYVARNMTTETSRSISVKITDWIQEQEPEPKTRHGCGPKHVENSPEDDQNTATPTAEIPKDQSH